jgi:hypothetical protein
LEVKDPNYLRTKATDFDEVLKAGQFVFSDDAFDADLNEPIITRIRIIRESRNMPLPGRVKAPMPLEDSDDEEDK